MISGTKVITHKQHTNTSCRMPNLFFQHLLTVAKNVQICNISSELYSGELWLVINYIGFPPQGISLQLTNCSGTELRNNSFIESYCLCYCKLQKITNFETFCYIFISFYILLNKHFSPLVNHIQDSIFIGKIHLHNCSMIVRT